MLHPERSDLRLTFGDSHPFVERDSYSGAALFCAMASASVIDQGSAHQQRGDAKELGSVLPTRILLIYEPDIRLMNQVGSLQRLPGTLAP